MVITDINQVVYQGDGINTAWPFTFRIIDASDIQLMIIEADGTETAVTSDYYVDTINNTVYYPGYAPGAEPPEADQPPVLSADQKLIVYRKLPITQEKDLGDKWPFSVIELGLDKLTMILQDIWDWCGRCLQVSRGQAAAAGDAFDPTVPMEAGKVVTGNAAGNGFEAREALMEVNGSWDGEGRQIHSVADPTGDQDAVTKKYADTRMDNNFMKLRPDGTAWEARNLPISNVAGPALIKDAANKDYVDRILAGYSGQGDRFVFFDNVAQMQAAELVPSQMAVTLGYYDVNDGGTGVYTIRDIGADTPDGGSIIEIPDTDYVAELITDGTVNVKQFGAYGDGTHDDTIAIQAAIDSGTKQVILTKGEYIVSKNSALDFAKHDEPCLLIKDKNRFSLIGDDAVLHVQAHGQGVLEVVNSSNITIKGIVFNGYGSFPAIGSPSGRCEKGATGEGYYDTEHAYQWSLYKNNSVDTSQYHGFESDANQVWGTFGNGFIGNCGSGVLVYDGCNNVLIDGCEASGFNHCGFEVGTRCVDSPVYNKNITIQNCYAHDIYTTGIQVMLSTEVVAFNNKVERIGHPSAFTEDNGETYAYTYADPGYGISFNAYQSPSDLNTYQVVRNGVMSTNTVTDCIRNGLDTHGGENIKAVENYVYSAYNAGMECVGYSKITGKTKNYQVSQNLFKKCGYCKTQAALLISNRQDAPVEWVYENCGHIVSENQFIECSATSINGIITASRQGYIQLLNNTIVGNLGGEGAGILVSGSNIKVDGNILDLPNVITNSLNIVPYLGSLISNNVIKSDSQLKIVDYDTPTNLEEATAIVNNYISNHNIDLDSYSGYIEPLRKIHICFHVKRTNGTLEYEIIEGKPYIEAVAIGTDNIASVIRHIQSENCKLIGYSIIPIVSAIPRTLNRLGMSNGDYVLPAFIKTALVTDRGNLSINVFNNDGTLCQMSNIQNMDFIFSADFIY